MRNVGDGIHAAVICRERRTVGHDRKAIPFLVAVGNGDGEAIASAVGHGRGRTVLRCNGVACAGGEGHGVGVGRPDRVQIDGGVGGIAAAQGKGLFAAFGGRPTGLLIALPGKHSAWELQ